MPIISDSRRLAVNIRDGFKCVYCQRSLRNAKPRQMHLDHLTPRSMGGLHGSENLGTCCQRCNCRKSDRYTWRQFCRLFYPEAEARIQRLRRRKVNVALAKSYMKATRTARGARRAAARATA